MSVIDIKRRHRLSRDAAKKKIAGLLRGLPPGMHGAQWQWVEKYVLEGAAPGLQRGRITLTAGLLHIEIELSFFVPAAPVRRRVLERLDLDFPEPE